MPLVPDMRGVRAFDKHAGTIVTLALAASVWGAVPAQALPRECAAIQVPHLAFHSTFQLAAAPPAARRVNVHRPHARRIVARNAARRWRKSPMARAIPMSFCGNAPIVRVAGATELRVAPTFSTTIRKIGSPNDVTLDFVAADINDVLKALAVQTRTNVVSGNDVKGRVTVSLSHVTLDEALDMISKLSGYQYAKVGRTYVVGSSASIATLVQSGTAQAASSPARSRKSNRHFWPNCG